MKKTIILVALLFAAIFAAGCGEKEAEGDKGVKDLKVALVLTGPINDGGWSQSAYEGLIGIAAKYDAQTAYLENVQAAQYNMSIRNYAKDGYNVIIANGAQFLDAVKEVSAEYPDTVFLVSSTDVTAKFGNGTNVSGVIGDGIEQGFLMGVTAAYLAQEQGSKKVAAVAGVEIPAFKKTLEGYNLGVAYVDKSIQVVQAFTGSTDDVNKLKEQALTFIQQGNTVVLSHANAATRGGYEATMGNAGTLSIGANASKQMFANYANNLAASGNIKLSQAFIDTVGYVYDGTFAGEDYIFGVDDGVVSLAMSTTEPTIKKVQDKVQKVIDEMKSGKLDVYDLIK